jgi:hypothetical protein
MPHNTTLSISSSSSSVKPSPAAIPISPYSKKTRRIFTLPGLTGPVVLVGSPRTKSVQNGTICPSILSLLADVLHLRAWRQMDPVACFMLAGYTAAVAQPLVFGRLGSTIVALMMPTK